MEPMETKQLIQEISIASNIEKFEEKKNNYFLEILTLKI